MSFCGLITTFPAVHGLDVIHPNQTDQLTPLPRYEIANGSAAWEDAEKQVKSKLQKSGKRDTGDVTVSVRGEEKPKKRKDVDEGKGGKGGGGKNSKKSKVDR